MLENAVTVLNRVAGHDPATAHKTPGAYVLSGAYGGWQLQQVRNESGGVTDFGLGFQPAKICMLEIRAYTAGFEAGLGAGK